jgi:hypothetical protein
MRDADHNEWLRAIAFTRLAALAVVEAEANTATIRFSLPFVFAVLDLNIKVRDSGRTDKPDDLFY